MGYVCVGYVWNGYVWDMCNVLDMCGICVVDTFEMDMCGICKMCWICVGYVWCEIRQQSSEEPCDETSFGKNGEIWVSRLIWGGNVIHDLGDETPKATWAIAGWWPLSPPWRSIRIGSAHCSGGHVYFRFFWGGGVGIDGIFQTFFGTAAALTRKQ